MATLNEFSQNQEQEKREENLKRTINHLMIQLERTKAKTEDLVNAVYRAAHEAASSIEIRPVKIPTKDPRKSKDEEVAIAILSDWQLAKVTPTYNSQICEERVELYIEKVIKLTKIQRADHPVRKVHVFLVGDMVEGELIFPGQAHKIDASLYRQVCVDGPRITCNAIRRLATEFEEVQIDSVIGNHGAIGGRSRKDMHPESNADLMMYTICKELLANENRIKFNVPFVKGERSWYSIVTIGNYRFFLFHSNQMSGGGFGGLPHYGFARAINNWASGVIPGGFDFAIAGHWHQAASMPFNSRILWINGSTESDNTWLQEELKVQCPPSQWLLFCHPKKGVTGEYRVWLT